MAAESKTSVAARFVNGAFVSAGDFSTLVDSYADYSDVLFAIATAAQGGAKGVVTVSGSSNVTFQSAAAQGLRLLNTATTAAAQQQLGGGTVGQVVFEAATTASAVGQIGAGTVGAQILATTTTAAAQAIVGSVSAATQAEMEAVASNSVVATPRNMHWHPGVAKAWLFASANTDVNIKASYNIATVSVMSTGVFNIVFGSSMSTSFYAVPGMAQYNNASRFLVMNSAQTVSAGGFSVLALDPGGSPATPVGFSVIVFGDL